MHRRQRGWAGNAGALQSLEEGSAPCPCQVNIESTQESFSTQNLLPIAMSFNP